MCAIMSEYEIFCTRNHRMPLEKKDKPKKKIEKNLPKKKGKLLADDAKKGNAISTAIAELGGRIKEERTRLGYTREDVGVRTSITTRTIISYEQGARKPSVEFLMAFAEIGADPYYILMGKRIAVDVSSSERQLIYNYRILTDKDRESVAHVVKRIALS